MGAITRAGAVLISILLVAAAWAIRHEVREHLDTQDQAAEVVAVRAAEQGGPREAATELVEPAEPEPAEPIVLGTDPSCRLLVGPTGWDDGEGEAWFDHLAEDGQPDYADGTWTVTHWDGTVEAVGWALAEDSAVWSGPRCGDLTWGYAG